MTKRNPKIFMPKKNTNTQEVKIDSYDTFKEYHGQKYRNMKIGKRHKWYYEQGEWKEQKQTPDLWHFEYKVKKSRAGKAPEGSGVPVGTKYNWYIMAHQVVEKLNAK